MLDYFPKNPNKHGVYIEQTAFHKERGADQIERFTEQEENSHWTGLLRTLVRGFLLLRVSQVFVQSIILFI